MKLDFQNPPLAHGSQDLKEIVPENNFKYTDSNKLLQDLRTFIRGAEVAADRSMFFSRSQVLFIGALALHGGEWSPLDLKMNNWRNDWKVGDQTMNSAEFGNYIAGYYAGFSNAEGIYEGMRAGGLIWAILGREERWDDSESVPFINAGFEAGLAERESEIDWGN